MRITLLSCVTLAAVLAPSGPAAADDLPPLSVYGQARLDFLIDDSRMQDVQQPLWVTSEPEGPSETDGEFSMHPRLSQLGLNLDEWRFDGGLKGAGKLEVDFRGGTGSAPMLGLRHAYFTLTAGHLFEMLAGQTWDLISPLYPTVNADTMMWNAGNTGDRRPQLRMTVTPTQRDRVAWAIAMTGAVDGQDLDGDGRLDGVASAVPMVQLLYEHRFRQRRRDPIRIGVWGHVGAEALGDGTQLASYSVGGHLFWPLARRVTLLGEAFWGQNLSDIRGGVGQGVNPVTGKEIHSRGGWLELVVMPAKSVMLATGATADVPYVEDLSPGDRDKNLTFYLSERFRPHRAFELGVEYIRWFTGYHEAPDGAANRFDLHLTMFF